MATASGVVLEKNGSRHFPMWRFPGSRQDGCKQPDRLNRQSGGSVL